MFLTKFDRIFLEHPVATLASPGCLNTTCHQWKVRLDLDSFASLFVSEHASLCETVVPQQPSGLELLESTHFCGD